MTLTPPTEFHLRFAKDAASAKPAPRFWRTPSHLGTAPEGQPLAGLKIALDPGHLGGPWAQIEERFFQIGESRPVTEGDMTLRVARMLVPKLEAPYSYTTGNAIRVADNPYIWARNLLANRLYHAPVIFLEPYVMNSEVIWERVQAGDYEGEQMIGGEMRRSIFREYADAVVEGLRDYYTKARAAQPAVPK
jgi:hypothetical protein